MKQTDYAAPTGLRDHELAQSVTTASSPTTLEPGARKLSVEFTGSGSEYFRIWIVNLLLTVVTVGFYFPWAKVRRLRYFYGNTLIDGEPLGFHGNAFKMFKGFVIVVASMAIYSVSGQVSQIAGFIAFLIFAGLWPALLKSSMQFRMANTSWRGLRFSFGGSTKDAYRACLPLFIPSLLILGLYLIAPELQHVDPAALPGVRWMIVFGLVMLCTVVISPWLMWNLKRYQHSHYQFSTERTRFNVGAISYFGLSLKTVGVMLLASIVVLIIAAVLAVIAAIFLGWLIEGSVGPILAAIAEVIFIGSLFSIINSYIVARFQNLVWNGTRSEHVKFASALRARDMAGLTLKNWILMMLTLGMYWPFATVAMTRMRLLAVQLESSVNPAALVIDASAVEGQAVGEAAGDFFGFDIGL